MIDDGCDLVCGSGDKLLGGPQCGLLIGRRELIEKCHEHPLYRALRPDRMCFAALEATLRLQLSKGPTPFDRLWSADSGELAPRLEKAARELDAEILPAEAYVGGGAAPEAAIAGRALTLADPAGALAERLRRGTPAVLGYVKKGRLMLDLRTVDPRDDEELVGIVRATRDRLARTS